MNTETIESEREKLARENAMEYSTNYELEKDADEGDVSYFSKLCYQDGYHDGHLDGQRQANDSDKATASEVRVDTIVRLRKNRFVKLRIGKLDVRVVAGIDEATIYVDGKLEVSPNARNSITIKEAT